MIRAGGSLGGLGLLYCAADLLGAIQILCVIFSINSFRVTFPANHNKLRVIG
jgi:hypothetical protein